MQKNTKLKIIPESQSASEPVLPLIDVIITCFNYGSYVVEAVNSVLRQTIPNVGVILIDGGSDDGRSPGIVRSLEHPRVKVFLRESRCCVGNNRNFGIHQSRAKYICCLDAADTLNPTYLEKALFLIESYGYDLVSTSTQFIGNDGGQWDVMPCPTLDALLEANQISTCAVFRRDVWQETGGYHDYGTEAQHVAEDWDLWIRIAALGARMRNISGERLLNYRIHDQGSLSHSPDIMTPQQQLDSILRKNKDILTPEARKKSGLHDFKKSDTDILGTDLVKAAINANHNPQTLMIMMPFMIMGGAERLLSNLTGYLTKLGWTVVIVTTKEQEINWGDTSDWFRKYTDYVYALPLFLEPVEWKDFISYLIAARKPHCILNVGSRIFYEMMPDVKKKYPSLPLVDLLFNTIGHTESHKEFRAFFDSVIAETQEVFDWLRNAGWDNDHIKKIVSGVCLETFQPRPRCSELVKKYKIIDDEIIVGFIGRIAEEKAPDLFVEVARHCAGIPKLRFVMRGAGELVDDVEAQIRTLPPEARLNFLVRMDEVAPFYSICDILLLTSRYDGRPMAVMEALASGVPVIASRVGGVPEMIEDKRNGFLCTPCNIAEFVEHIQKLVADKSLLRSMKKEARLYAEKNFDADLSFACYHDALYPLKKLNKPLKRAK